jgi:hypothetical protein
VIALAAEKFRRWRDKDGFFQTICLNAVKPLMPFALGWSKCGVFRGSPRRKQRTAFGTHPI